jgi:hypothetical protein
VAVLFSEIRPPYMYNGSNEFKEVNFDEVGKSPTNNNNGGSRYNQ